MANAIDFDEYLLEKLKDTKIVEGYLNATLEDEDTRVFLLTLRNVAKAQGGIAPLSIKMKKSRNTLYKTLSNGGYSPLENTRKILKALGFSLQIHISR